VFVTFVSSAGLLSPLLRHRALLRNIENHPVVFPPAIKHPAGVRFLIVHGTTGPDGPACEVVTGEITGTGKSPVLRPAVFEHRAGMVHHEKPLAFGCATVRIVREVIGGYLCFLAEYEPLAALSALTAGFYGNASFAALSGPASSTPRSGEGQ